jgi:nucleotide-binding universal stress UspA family protein
MNSPQQWKKIVVPTDFSSCAEIGVQAAAGLQRASGAEVLLLHVTEPAHSGLRVQTGDLHDAMRKEAEAKLRKVATEAFSAGAHVRVMAKEGHPADVICKAAADEKADAIIIPTHGHSGLVHMLLGSVAEKVVRHARCSVLVVRE